MSHPKNYARAATFALSAFTGWTISDALLKFVRTDGIPQSETLLISGVSGMAIIFLIAALRGKIRNLQPRQGRGLLAIGICQSLAAIAWLIALPRLPLVNLYVVMFITPMTVACLATLVLKEHLGWKRGLAIFAGFIGVVIAINPLALMQNSGAWTAYLAVFAGMASTATQMLMMRVVSQTETSECIAFYPRAGLLITGAIACGATGLVAMPQWFFIAVCASGALGGIGWALMSQAYKNAPAAAVAPFHYSQMISGAILGYLFWGDVPGAWLIAGAVIIIASGVYLVRHERRASRTMVRG